MNDPRFDATLVAAAKRRSDDTNTFVRSTMQKIKASTPQSSPRKAWLFQLHRPAIALAAFVALIVLGGAVYAAVHFAPTLVQLLGKETNPRGATEYSVSGFAECAERKDSPVAKRFEIKSDAPQLSDEEVQKILQAKCELKWLETFPEKHWPKQGPPSETWKEGDTVTYSRLDVLGKLEKLNTNTLTVNADFVGSKTYTTASGETIKAFAGGKEVALSDLRSGDAVFAIARYSEPTNNWSLSDKMKDNPNFVAQPEQPKLLGVVGAFKMTLPLEYYTQKQQYITEIPECIGNEGELCPQTPSVDVYPRNGSEGPINPYLVEYSDPEFREISGEITELTDDTMILKSRSGTLYTVTVGDAGFKVYNRDFTAPYAQNGIDAHIKVGSHAAVRYAQPKGADRTKVPKEHVQMISLQLEALNVKKGNVKQY